MRVSELKNLQIQSTNTLELHTKRKENNNFLTSSKSHVTYALISTLIKLTD